MTIFYSVTFKIITIFHMLAYQERKLYQRDANKNKHGILILRTMTELNEQYKDTKRMIDDRLTKHNIIGSRLLIEIILRKQISSIQIPLALYVTVNSLLMTKIGIVK